jgi:hypothetical protein
MDKRPEANHQFELGRKLDRQIARLFAIENTDDIGGGNGLGQDHFRQALDPAHSRG